MQNIFLKKEKASLSYKILSFFFVFSLILSSFAPSLVIAQEVVAEAEQQIVEEQKVVEETVVEEVVSEARTGLEINTPQTGSITVCKIILDSEGNVVKGTTGTTFTIPGMPIGTVSSQNNETQVAVLTDTTYSTPLNLNSEIISEDDAECVTYSNLAAGHYFYGEEIISDSSNWEAPKYNDQVSVNIQNLNDFFEYNGALFTETTEDDAGRNQNADGDILLGNGAHRTLVVLNQMKEQKEEVCENPQTMSVSSQGSEDGSELIDGGPAKAVIAFGPMDIWGLITGTNWIWSSNHVANPTQDETKTISKWFSVPGPVTSANLQIFADNSYKVTLNSQFVHEDEFENNYHVGPWGDILGNGGDSFSINPVYFSGAGEGNTIYFEVKNFGKQGATATSNPAGVDFKLDISYCGDKVEPVSTITVIKDVVGGEAEVSDFPLFVDETPVDSGEQNQFAPGTYTIHEDGDENYIPSFSGACIADFNNANRINMIHDWVEKRNALMIAHPNSPNIADINAKIDALLNSITATITLGEDENAECAITNTYTDHTTEYGAYCGDGNIDTSLGETCDGGESCTDQCQGANVCSEKAFARVVVPAGSSHIKNFGNGNMTSDVFLGGNTIGSKIPNGTWFMIHDGTNWITDSEALNPNVGAYEDVPGFAVQRGANFVRLSMYSSSSPKTVPTTKEHADGWLEFFNIDTTGLAQVSDGDDNIVEKSNDTLKDYTPGQDELSVSDGKSNFWLTVGPEDDSFKTTFENRIISECGDTNGGETCEENPNQEKCNENPGGGGNGGGNGGSSRSGSRPTGSVLGDSTTDLPGQVLGATLAQTGTDASPMLVLGATILGLLFITRRKAFKFN